MSINFNELPETAPEEWFDYKEEEEGGVAVRVKIRFLDDVTDAELRRKASKDVRLRGRSRPRFNVGDMFDTAEYERLRLDHALVAWEGVVVRNGDGVEAPVPCTTDNKMKVLSYYRDLRAFILDTAEDYQTFQRERAENERKNSASGRRASSGIA